MNKFLSKFLKIFILTNILFFSLNDINAQTDQSKNQKKESLYDAVVNFVAPPGSLQATIFPKTKNCNFIDLKRYQPFSGIDKTFPGAEGLGFVEVEAKNGKPDEKITCIQISGGVENILKVIYTFFISIIIIASVINISISGIQFMTEEASGQIKGGAKKRLTDSFIALGLGLLSYPILYTINKQLVVFDFDPSKIDTDKSIEKGIQSAQNADLSGLWNIEVIKQTNVPNSPFTQDQAAQPSFNETFTNGNFSTYASFGSIRCEGSICRSSKPTVFGYKDGDGTVGLKGDNGIGNARWSTKPGCTYDTGNTITYGVALPQAFWGAAGIKLDDVKYIGIKLYVNGIFKKILPVVDDSQSNLDLTFAAARAYIDPTITDSNRLNTTGKDVSFEIVKDYYKTNPKTDIVWTSNKSTFTNKIPCNI